VATCDTLVPTPPPIPPCYNNGTFCNGQGDCVVDNVTLIEACVCLDGFTGLNCSQPPIPPCFNNGSFCNGNGACVNDTCECIPLFKGSNCSTPNPPPLSCLNLSFVTNCSDCLQQTNALGLDCAWCPNVTEALLLLKSGNCINATACKTPYIACNAPAPFTPPACPDNCTNNGICVNSSVCAMLESTKGNGDCGKYKHPQFGCPNCGKNANATAKNNQTSACACYSGASGLNCAVVGGKSLALAALSAGIVAAIVIAALLLFAIFGGGTYAISQKVIASDEASVYNNPLYDGQKKDNFSPIHQQC